MDICGYAEKLIEAYLYTKSVDGLGDLPQLLDNDIVVIGTGKHEISQGLPEFVNILSFEDPLRSNIKLEIESLWTKELSVTDDVKLVYGEVCVRGITPALETVLKMDMRHSFVFKKISDEPEENICASDWRKFGEKWKLINIHQSVPYIDQRENEFYPKTLLEEVDEANQKIENLEKLADTDRLTGILNHNAFYEQSEQLLDNEHAGYCMAIDIDDFKGINDNHGHLVGDEVLCKMGRLLSDMVGDNGLAGRIGGDEFAVFLHGGLSSQDVCALAETILRQVDEYACAGIFPSVSIGVSKVKRKESLKNAFRRADEHLYKVKRSGKRGYKFHD